MLSRHKVIALIPARSGSKRLPNKNILPLAGVPLIAWSINAAKASTYVDRIVVSTDCANIASLAEEYGAESPFIRPKSLSEDTSSTFDVILHTITALNLTGEDILLLLQPTSPLRTAAHIDGALFRLEEKVADGVVSVTPCSHSPLWFNTLPEDGSMNDFIRSEIRGVRSQDLPQFYRLNGAIYAFKVSSLLKNKSIHYSKNVFSYVMPENCSLDIDTEIDFKICELFASLI